MSLTRVNQFVALKVFFHLLDNLDTHLKIMGAVGINQLADLLPLVGALLDQGAIVTEQVPHEELIEVVCGCVLV